MSKAFSSALQRAMDLSGVQLTLRRQQKVPWGALVMLQDDRII